jgi:two-component system OmpR family response regulator
MRLLVVEDDAELCQHLQSGLRQAGYAVDLAGDGVEGEFLGDSEPYDAAILDLGLPRRPGLEVLRNWRGRDNSLPVIVLTARDSWHERVDGLKAGADDYLGKPFHMAELLARIEALLRRRHTDGRDTLSSGPVSLQQETQILTTEDGRQHPLTATEFRLLRYLMLHPGKVLSKSRLAEHVYEYDGDRDSNVIEVYINRLRKLLGKQSIRTRRGQGYVFQPQTDAAATPD